MDAPTLRFEESGHRYFIGDAEMPSITTVMAAVGIPDFSAVPPDVLSAAADRGKAVHHACHLHDLGKLDYGSLDAKWYPYLSGWARFCDQYEFIQVLQETPLYCPQKGYAGTPDRAGTLLWKGKRVFAVVEIKSGKLYDDAPGVQTAAQEHLIRVNDVLPLTKRDRVLRLSVHLSGTDMFTFKHTVEEHENPNDFAVFLSALTIWNYKRR